MCVVKLGSFHGCFFCKVNQRGCSLCPKVTNEKGELVNICRTWCWFLTVVHHIASILDMEDPEGPISTLPVYDGVTFPSFDRSLAKLISKFKTTMSDVDIKAQWNEIRKKPIQPYYGVPHKKLLSLEHRPVRGRFPIIGSGQKVERRLCDILRDAEQGKLARLWAVGYNDVWTRSNEGPAETGRYSASLESKAGSYLEDPSEEEGGGVSDDDGEYFVQ